MTLSNKWTAVSFLTLTIAAAGTFAFAGCTVTSGSVNDEGGIGNPAVDAGTTDSGGDAAPSATCEGNKQDPTKPFVDAKCQGALSAACCTELKGCFNVVSDADGGADAGDGGAAASVDCATYAECVDVARAQPTEAEQQAAQDECDLASSKEVQDAYEAIVNCALKDTAATAACQ